MKQAASSSSSSSPAAAVEPAQAFHILINEGSGGAMRTGRAKFEAMAADTGLDIASFSLLPGPDFTAKLKELMADETPVLIGGGDGTIAHAATVHIEHDKPFGILPMGTMNMLAKDLGIPSVLETANIFDLYRRTRTQLVDVGTINDRPFLCCAALGTIPEAAVFREEIRDNPDLIMLPRLTAHIMNQMSPENMRKIQLTADGRTTHLETAALVVSNNCFAPASEAHHRLAKSSLQEGMLGIYSASPQSFFERIRLLMHLQQGDLQAENSVQEMQAVNVCVETGNAEELVSVDGEPMTMKTPLNFNILNGALKMIVPVMETGPS